MKILLIHPFLDADLLEDPYPPVGLGYLATSLRKDQHDVRILDCQKDCKILTKKEFLAQASPGQYDIIGLSVYTATVRIVQKMIQLLKQNNPKAIIVLGGPHISSIPQSTFIDFPEADFAIQGDGEIPFLALTNSICSKSPVYEQIEGLIYKKSEETIINTPCFPKNVNDYGIPAWDLISPHHYYKFLSISVLKNSAPIFLTRGCPFRCTFCAAKLTSGQKLRKRSLDHIFSEIHFLKEKYNVKNFLLVDEGSGTSKDFIIKFCDRLKKENIKAKFSMGVGMRLDIVDNELLSTMRNTGFNKNIVFGIESGSDRILKLMKKNITTELIKEKINLIAKNGFNPAAFFILGYPGETEEEMEKTINLSLQLPLTGAFFTIFQPLLGTEATNQLICNQEISPDFYLTQNDARSLQDIPLHRINKIRRKAFRKFFFRPRILIHHMKSFRQIRYSFLRFASVFLKRKKTQTWQI